MSENYLQIFLDQALNSVWSLFKDFWWFWLLLFIIWLATTIFPELKNKILREKKFSGIESMKNDRQILYNLKGLKPTEFEDYIASLYVKLGYKTERVGQSHDGGVDVIAEKDGITHYIQCKKFITRKVRVGDVRDFYGAISAKLTQGNGIFITTNYFTTEAKKFAEDNMIEVIDGHALLKLVRLVSDETGVADVINKETSQEVGICPKCGSKLVLRNSKYGDFYGCSGFPKCKFIKKI